MIEIEIIKSAIVYSCIAFSIVFIVLGGLTLVIFAMRLLTGSSSAGGSGAAGGKPAPTKAAPGVTPPASGDVKSQHVAAITAAILAATRGRGQGQVKILNVTPAAGAFSGLSKTTTVWRTAAIVEAVGRRLTPSWKR
jgi:Na+-transporting methylmalonyl-CoA/oxaloacetate decarboxylase gamma subunit